jgi:hypothetical protein
MLSTVDPLELPSPLSLSMLRSVDHSGILAGDAAGAALSAFFAAFVVPSVAPHISAVEYSSGTAGHALGIPVTVVGLLVMHWGYQ